MSSKNMNKEEALRVALRELGPVADQELTAFMEQRFGVKVRPQFMPLLKASLAEMERLERTRSAAKAVEPAATEPAMPTADVGVA